MPKTREYAFVANFSGERSLSRVLFNLGLNVGVVLNVRKTTGTQTDRRDERRRLAEHSGRCSKQDDRHAECFYLLMVCQALSSWLSPHSHELFSKIVVDSFHRSLLPLRRNLADSTSEHALVSDLDSILDWFFFASRNARWSQNAALSGSAFSPTNYAAERSGLLDHLLCSLKRAVHLELETVNFGFGTGRF